ncbi:MAG: Ig-like domain-containing protein [Methanobacteriaceae archaeon]|nr:Ig-like domain-containing protein [Methanobacteriaceae archaeon]
MVLLFQITLLIFKENTAKEGEGGAIYNGGSIDYSSENIIEKCDFINNIAGRGSAICSEKNLTIRNIENNYWGSTNPNWSKLLYNTIKPISYYKTSIAKKLDSIIQVNPITCNLKEKITLTGTIKDSDGKNIPHGKVAFKLNGKTLGYSNITNGIIKYQYTIPATYSAKNYTITVTYGENTKYFSSNNKNTLTIKPYKTTLTIKTTPSFPGRTTIFTAHIKSNTNLNATSGNVIFKINGKTVSKKIKVINGIATFQYNIPNTWSSKNYTVTATYSGNYQFETTKITKNFSVSKLATKLVTNSIVAKIGQTINIQTTLNDVNGNKINTGTVTYKINNKTILTHVKVINGTATGKYTIPKTFTIKNYQITTIYSGNNQCRNNTFNSTLKITS